MSMKQHLSPEPNKSPRLVSLWSPQSRQPNQNMSPRRLNQEKPIKGFHGSKKRALDIMLQDSIQHEAGQPEQNQASLQLSPTNKLTKVQRGLSRSEHCIPAEKEGNCRSKIDVNTKNRQDNLSPRRQAVSPTIIPSPRNRGHVITQSNLNKFQKVYKGADSGNTTQQCTQQASIIQNELQLSSRQQGRKTDETNGMMSSFIKKRNFPLQSPTVITSTQRLISPSRYNEPNLMDEYRHYLQTSQMKRYLDLRQTSFTSKPTSVMSGRFEIDVDRRKKSFDVKIDRYQLSGLDVKLSDFHFGKCIGNGKFGQVYLAKHRKTGMIVAIKKICKFTIKEYKMEKQIAEEIKLQSFCNNPNIINLYGFFYDELHIYLILQYSTDGTLFNYLHKHGSKLSEQVAAPIVKQVVFAVYFLHQNDIAHRDIKPQNIVLSSGVAKLCDFGWSARVLETRKSYCGTFDYTPPEILERKEYDVSVDLWCLGVLTYELLTGQVPFSSKDKKAAISKIINVDKQKICYPCELSINARNFIESLLRKDPRERPKPEELMEHPFFNKKHI